MSDIAIYAGNYSVINFSGYKDGEPLNLSGASLWFTVKNYPLTASNLLQKTTGDGISLMDNQTGAKVILSISDTSGIKAGRYNYDFQYKTGESLHTLGRGDFIVLDRITSNV